MRILPEVIKNLFRKPFTHKYPYQPIVLPHGFRGDFSWDREKCVFCEECERICPVGAIRVDRGDVKKFEVDMGKCIFCAECEKACPKDAIRLEEKITPVEIERSRTIRKLQ
ncbi:MAG: 4Fe-4S binding protein [Candidatus Aenigmarchaeota archaeon]|nr:4Fe-4S binding protein [Candidatus Aenigmarchaeota archaeon]